MSAIRSSPRAVAAIEGFEISDAATYARTDLHPTWPGGASGPTIGVGYDLGYHAAEEIGEDWGPFLPAAAVARMKAVAGIKGQAARSACVQLADIAIPYAAARAVFEEVDIPRTERQVLAAFPNSIELSGDSFGALTSLVFNRGPNCSDTPSRREMHAIQIAIAARRYGDVDSLIRAMKRLWTGNPELRGLCERRDAEATLYRDGMAESAAIPAAEPEAPPAPAAGGLTADDLMAAELAGLSNA